MCFKRAASRSAEAPASWPGSHKTVSGEDGAVQGGSEYEFEPRVIAYVEPEHFAWVARTGVRGMFDGEHHFKLEKTNEGGTVLHNYENYSGLMPATGTRQSHFFHVARSSPRHRDCSRNLADRRIIGSSGSALTRKTV